MADQESRTGKWYSFSLRNVFNPSGATGTSGLVSGFVKNILITGAIFLCAFFGLAIAWAGVGMTVAQEGLLELGIYSLLFFTFYILIGKKNHTALIVGGVLYLILLAKKILAIYSFTH
jgi:hypothetical protein